MSAPRIDSTRMGEPSYEVPPEAKAFGDRLTQMANELLGPLRCTQPAYGAPGRAHCAACCGGTGVVVITSADEQAVYEAAMALKKAAAAIYTAPYVASTRPPLVGEQDGEGE